MKNEKVALVTGASSGFGERIADALQEAGFRVFGTSREPSGHPRDYEMLALDVTSRNSIDACVEEIRQRAGRIDLLVNNAGCTHGSLVEETSLETARQIFEVNFWGVVQLTSVVLPMMRQQRAGKIINVGSLSGLVGTPGQGLYSASKHALEGYTETLRAEIGFLPIEVSLVEPGFFRTGLAESRLRSEADPVADYDPVRGEVLSRLGEGFESGGDPREVARRILELVREEKPPLRNRIGRDAFRVSRLKKWLPESLFLKGMRKQFGLDV